MTIYLSKNLKIINEVCTKIFSYIAKQPFKMSEFSKVNKQGQFQSFKNCMNYLADMDLFPQYSEVKGKSGFYLMDSLEFYPDTSINFKGKVYILTNEQSFSASAVLASLIYKHKRGAVVGREAGTTYYQLNAGSFADMRLPNSGVDIRIPLVKYVFASELDAGIPWGRGVLPDYPVPFTLEEIDFESGDAILNYALQLIEDGKYIEEFESSNVVMTISLIAGGFVIIGMAILILRNGRKKRSR